MCELQKRGLAVKVGDKLRMTKAGLRIARENDAEDLRRRKAS